MNGLKTPGESMAMLMPIPKTIFISLKKNIVIGPSNWSKNKIISLGRTLSSSETK